MNSGRVSSLPDGGRFEMLLFAVFSFFAFKPIVGFARFVAATS
jgi:hypothetical protein